mgnify:CR=1 FL=1
MKLLIAAATLALAVIGGPVYAACTYPTSPDKIPNGATASMEDMLAAKKQVEQYNKDMNAYMSCIKLEYDSQVASNDGTLTAEDTPGGGLTIVVSLPAAARPATSHPAWLAP